MGVGDLEFLAVGGVDVFDKEDEVDFGEAQSDSVGGGLDEGLLVVALVGIGFELDSVGLAGVFDGKIDFAVAGGEFRDDCAAGGFEEFREVGEEVEMEDCFVESEVASAGGVFEEPVFVLVKVSLVEVHEVGDIDVGVADDVVQWDVGIGERPHVVEQAVGKVIEQAFLDKGAGELYEVMDVVLDIFVHHSVHVERVDDRVVEAEFELFRGLEHVEDKILFGALADFADDVDDIVVGQRERGCRIGYFEIPDGDGAVRFDIVTFKSLSQQFSEPTGEPRLAGGFVE